jgi:hypothetical protein
MVFADEDFTRQRLATNPYIEHQPQWLILLSAMKPDERPAGRIAGFNHTAPVRSFGDGDFVRFNPSTH